MQMILTTTKSTQCSKEFCYPRWEPIEYSLAGRYYNIVPRHTRYQKDEDNNKHKIIHKILEECEPNELSMKVFTHALCGNPNRSNEELMKLHSTLQEVSQKYCLLYLAIFPIGYKIRRLTLIGRWVAEGLITKEDWPSSVCEANRCFDVLINWCLVYLADTGATGKVKSCMVGDPCQHY